MELELTRWRLVPGFVLASLEYPLLLHLLLSLFVIDLAVVLVIQLVLPFLLRLEK